MVKITQEDLNNLTDESLFELLVEFNTLLEDKDIPTDEIANDLETLDAYLNNIVTDIGRAKEAIQRIYNYLKQ